MRRIYLDSAPVIYLVEQVSPFYTRLQSLLDGSDLLVLSDLTRLECRVLPMRRGDTQLLADYDSFFTTRVSEVVPLEAAVIDRATEIRAYYSFGVADSIHLAAAMAARCDLFLTNDVRLAGFEGIQVVTVSSG
ncbi:MAG: PIN domain-containing protein [bacterium]|nr:PIN domain-containing protein [bacterium]MCS7310823.1 PIN domain-containing protein [Armatimonadota bacterium]